MGVLRRFGGTEEWRCARGEHMAEEFGREPDGYPLKLPRSVKEAAARLAREDGVSLNQWIATAVAEKIGAVEATAEFLRRRAAGATATTCCASWQPRPIGRLRRRPSRLRPCC